MTARTSGHERTQVIPPPATGSAPGAPPVIEEIELGGVPETSTEGKKRRWPPRWWRRVRQASGWMALWLALVLATVFGRSAWPIDEARMLGVAWEMLARGAWLVPTVNGEPLANAPLLYWLVRLAWGAFGLDATVARLLPPVFALATALVMIPLARRLWPETPDVAHHAPFLLFGTFAFAASAPLLLPVMPLVFFTVLAVWALVLMWRARDARAWLLLGLALGFGLLAQGVFILVYVLPLALLAPLWAHAPARPRWRHWYADVFKAMALAAAMLAAWLVPATLKAGPQFAWDFVFAAARLAVLEPFSPTQPSWWYALALPLVLLPWALLPFGWMRFWRARREPIAAGQALCLLWIAVPVALLSLLEVKQPQFLLPLVPAASLFGAWLLFDPKLAGRADSDPFGGLVLPFLVIGLLMAVTPKLPRVDFLPALLWELSPFVGVAVIVVGVVSAWLPTPHLHRRVLDTATGAALLVVIAILALGWKFNDLQRVEPAAAAVAAAQRAGRTVAHVGDYHGELHFAGRLTRPLKIVSPSQAPRWSAWHPQGVIITHSTRWQPPPAAGAKPLYQGVHRDGITSVWDSSAIEVPVQRPSGDAPPPS